MRTTTARASNNALQVLAVYEISNFCDPSSIAVSACNAKYLDLVVDLNASGFVMTYCVYDGVLLLQAGYERPLRSQLHRRTILRQTCKKERKHQSTSLHQKLKE